MEQKQLEQFLLHILTPIYQLLEDDTIQDPQMCMSFHSLLNIHIFQPTTEELKTLSTELQDLVQTKVRVTKFSAIYNQIHQGTLGACKERKSAKVVQATINSKTATKRKAQRNMIKKESRKRKDHGFAYVLLCLCSVAHY
jgi:U3 small nucleolar RNA-associated protein 20